LSSRRSLILVVRLRPPSSTLFPYTTLFRSSTTPPGTLAIPSFPLSPRRGSRQPPGGSVPRSVPAAGRSCSLETRLPALISALIRSEEHTSELQSRFDLVCRLLLEKKKIKET